MDKNEAYQNFKDTDGNEYNRVILEAINNLKEKKLEIKELAELCN